MRLNSIRNTQLHCGGVASPFDSWLVLRGLRTLSVRMRAHCHNAMRVATYLNSHPKVIKVYYPGLGNDSGHKIALKQVSGT